MESKGVRRRDVLTSVGLGVAAVSLGSAIGCSSPKRTASALGAVSASAAKKKGKRMHAMTASNLRSAFGGESMAHMRYLAWADKAESEGFANTARLFRAISYAEQIHAHNHFRVMANEAGGFLVASMGGFGLGSTSANLAGAIEGETFEVTEMYPAYKAAAGLQGENDAVRTCQWALEAEKIHVQMYANAKKAVDNGQDVALGPVQICKNCGYTAEGAAPERCPICGVGKAMFKSFA